jgi:hypothetical protein
MSQLSPTRARRLFWFIAVVLGCASEPPPVGQMSESEATTDPDSTDSDSTDTNSTATTSGMLDVPDSPDPDVELVFALGRGIFDGPASFAPPQRFAAPFSVHLTALHDVPNGRSYVALWNMEQVCLASVSTQDGISSLAWLDCVLVDVVSDAARMDADADGVDELLVIQAGESFASFRLDPDSPSGLAPPVVIPNPTEWDWPVGVVTGPIDAVPGDEAVVSGSVGDPVLGGGGDTVILHGGQPLAAMVLDGYGHPSLGELTGDAWPDLLIDSTIYRGTGDVDLVEYHDFLNPIIDGRWTMDAQGDGIDDVARVEDTGLGGCQEDVLELHMGPIDGPSPAILVDGTLLDNRTALLPGDLDHDGIDELVSVGIGEWSCPGPAQWTITSLETGTSASADLCDNADCVIYEYKPGIGNFRYSVAAELIDVDLDGNLDLAALVVVQD